MRLSRWTAAPLVGCLLSLLSPAAVRADQILPIDGGWQPFTWIVQNNHVDLEGAFTFTSLGPVKLSVTDAFMPGDRFHVRDHHHLLGLTSNPTRGGSWTSNPNTAFGSAYFSWGVFALGPGAHSITLRTFSFAPNFKEGKGF